MSQSGRNTSSKGNLRGVASSNSSKSSNLERNDKPKPKMGFSFEEPVSGGNGSNKDDITNKGYRVLDATNAQDTDESFNMEMPPGLEDYKYKYNQSLKDGSSRLVRSRSQSPSRNFRWDSDRVGGFIHPCRDFVAGKCRRGNQCRFFHHYSIGRSDRTCFNYGKGKCRMGASCKYLHSDSFDQFRNISMGEQGGRYGRNQNGDNIPCKYFASGKCRNGISCRFSHARFHDESPFSSDMKEANWTAKNDIANVHISHQTLGVDIWPHNEKMSPPNWIYDVKSSTQQVSPGQVFHQNVSKEFNKSGPAVRFPKQRDPRCSSHVVKNEHPVQLQKGENKIVEKSGHLENLGENSGPDEAKKIEDVKAIRAFKFSLVEFVKELLKPTWKDGKITKEDYKAIVKKVTDKVIDSRAHIPQTQEKIDGYLTSSKAKLNKLVQAYVEKFQKA